MIDSLMGSAELLNQKAVGLQSAINKLEECNPKSTSSSGWYHTDFASENIPNCIAALDAAAAAAIEARTLINTKIIHISTGKASSKDAAQRLIIRSGINAIIKNITRFYYIAIKANSLGIIGNEITQAFIAEIKGEKQNEKNALQHVFDTYREAREQKIAEEKAAMAAQLLAEEDPLITEQRGLPEGWFVRYSKSRPGNFSYFKRGIPGFVPVYTRPTE